MVYCSTEYTDSRLAVKVLAPRRSILLRMPQRDGDVATSCNTTLHPLLRYQHADMDAKGGSSLPATRGLVRKTTPMTQSEVRLLKRGIKTKISYATRHIF